MQEAAEEVALAEDANRRVEEENEALRQQLVRVQEQLQAIQMQPSPGASPQVDPVSPAQSLGHSFSAPAVVQIANACVTCFCERVSCTLVSHAYVS